MKEILNAVSNWQQIAESTGISRREIEVMEQAFTTEP